MLRDREREYELRADHHELRREPLEQPPHALVLDEPPEYRHAGLRRVERTVLHPRLDDVEGLRDRDGRRGAHARRDRVLRPGGALPVLAHAHERLGGGVPAE